MKNTHVTAARPAAGGARVEAAPARPALRDTVLTAVGLAVLSLVAFYPAFNNGFIILDDEEYVVKNLHVRGGLTQDNLTWAFATFRTGNWHPLTWLSLQADAALSGPGPAGFHRTNVFLHAASAVLLFLALVRMTGKQWESVVVAALFAVHPMRAESVAWVAERKDVLSTFFGLFALLAYACYAAAPSVLKYLAVATLFALSLLAKPMWVTFPCLLLLLDWWPLGRIRLDSGAKELPTWRARSWPLFEKIPLFVLAAGSCVVTWLAQREAAAATLERVPLGPRLANAVVSYAAYLYQTVLPVGLAPFYPLPKGVRYGAVAVSAVLFATISAVVWSRRQSRPYLVAGWLWYLGTLVPVIGLVQVGGQARADRYSYLPLIGVYLMVVWWLGEEADRRNARRAALAASVVAVVVLTVLCQYQVSLWHDDIQLWQHTVAVTDDNWMAQLCLGDALEKAKKPEAALEHFANAAKLRPDYDVPQVRYAQMLLGLRRMEEARSYLTEAITHLPGSPLLRTALGIVYHTEGDLESARACYEYAIRLDPNTKTARANLGAILWTRRDLQGALEQLRRAVVIEPYNDAAYFNLGAVLEDLGQPDEAAAAYARSVALNPGLKQKLEPSLRRRVRQPVSSR